MNGGMATNSLSGLTPVSALLTLLDGDVVASGNFHQAVGRLDAAQHRDGSAGAVLGVPPARLPSDQRPTWDARAPSTSWL